MKSKTKARRGRPKTFRVRLVCYVLPDTAKAVRDLTRSGLADVSTVGKVVDKAIQRPLP
jgi:hypothetical protein